MDAMNLAILILRVGIGGTLVMHGYGKVFQGGGISGTAGWFDSMGMKPGKVHAWMAALIEIGAGVLVVLGLFTSLAAAAMVGVMVVAAWTVHRHNGFMIMREGWEYTFVLAVVAIGIAMLGPMKWSLDSIIGIDDAWDGYIGLAIAGGGGVLAGIGQLVLFYRPPESLNPS
ncbi:MAG: DoxX family protein [Acidimicrobiia bacterium]|nr:DoxX family protein [Acidimicrobiia bacterium]MYC57579.1 DoxX family protein [Acidimicrobiia bacterium]MYG94869.1 DoxX family protein [Acidimicrobiia bacterium]MYI31290.1 DoxX family protein [Acidimicrobiia bacterium]